MASKIEMVRQYLREGKGQREAARLAGTHASVTVRDAECQRILNKRKQYLNDSVNLPRGPKCSATIKIARRLVSSGITVRAAAVTLGVTPRWLYMDPIISRYVAARKVKDRVMLPDFRTGGLRKVEG